MVLFHADEEEEEEEAYCSCRRRIPRDWLKKTVDEIKEQQRIDEACGVEVAEEREMVGPPPKKTKGEKAEETAESSEAEETMENAQEESVDYNKLYSKFIQRALDTIGDKFNWLQDCIARHGVNYNSKNFRNFVEYMGMLQKVLTLVQQLEDNDRKGEKNN